MVGENEQGGTEVVGELAAKRERRSYATEWKRRVVQETLVPGASVSLIARIRGVNANQVFFWRRLYKRGLLESKKTKAAALLPVTISDAPVKAGERESSPMKQSSSPGIIHIELAKARLRIEGEADPASLRIALECLLR